MIRDVVNLATSPTELPGGRMLGPHGSERDTAEGVEVDEALRALVGSGRVALREQTDDPLTADNIGDLTIEDVLKEVGDDPEQRAIALAAESSRDKPRQTLLDKLEADE